MQKKRAVLHYYEEETKTAQESASSSKIDIIQQQQCGSSSSAHENLQQTAVAMISNGEQGQRNVIMSNQNPSRGSNYNRTNNSVTYDNNSSSSRAHHSSIMTSLHYSHHRHTTSSSYYAATSKLISPSNNAISANTNNNRVAVSANHNGINFHRGDDDDDEVDDVEVNRKSRDEGHNSKHKSGYVGSGKGITNSGGGGVIARGGINSEGDPNIPESVEKPQSRKSQPFYYCKTLGWDPHLNKFHIQLDTVDLGESRQAATVVDKTPMTSTSNAFENPLPSLESSSQQSGQQLQATANTVITDQQYSIDTETGTTDTAASTTTTTTTTVPCPPLQTNKETVISRMSSRSSESRSLPGSPASSTATCGREGDNSPSVSVIAEHGVNTSRTFLHQPTKREPVEATQTEQRTPTPAQSPCDSNNTLLPTDGGSQNDTNSREKTATDNDKDDDDNRLVIDDQEETPHPESRSDNNNKNVEAVEEDRNAKDMTDDEERVDERRERRESHVEERLPLEPEREEEAAKTPERRSPVDRNKERRERRGTREDDDFQCSQCQKVFTCDADLQTHFSQVHVRVAHASIQEPESPFPTITVRGTSSIFEDEVEESEPYSVATAPGSSSFHSNTLSSLLARRRSEEAERLMVEPIISSYMHGRERTAHMLAPFGAQTRPPFPARGMPPSRPPMSMMPQEYLYRQGSRPEHRIPVTPSSSSRMPLPYRPGYPVALHQALVTQHSAAVNQNSIASSRPQLRPIASTALRGGPVMHLPSRPPLTSRPPPMQASAQFPPQRVAPPNQHSMVRASPPLSQPPPQHQHNSQSILRNPQQNAEPDLARTLQHRMQQVQEQINALNQQAELDHTPAIQIRINKDKECLYEHIDHLQQQMRQLHNPQQLQQQLQRQQMQQMQIQQQHQQQLRQQQMQQNQQQQRAGNVVVNNPAVVSKRPSADGLDVTTISAHPKQARLDGMHYPNDRSDSLTAAGYPNNSDLSVRLPNGVTLSVLPHSSEPLPSPPASSSLMVTPGVHSGGSSSSRHSSGTTSPALISPGTVASRLAGSGITLTPASPAPLPLTPPANPVLSPISDCASSPRGSPRIPVSTVIQRVPPMGSPVAKTSSSPLSGQQHQQEVNFAIPKAPAPLKPSNTGVNNNAILTYPNAERPERPPTIDLTDDEIQNHNAQMRATGGGVVTQEQIQNHELMLQRMRVAAPGSGQLPAPPGTTVNFARNKSVPCPQCHGQFASVEIMNEHRHKAHGQSQHYQNTPNVPVPYNRQPQVAVRRSSPSSIPNPNNIIAPRMDMPHPGLSIRGSAPVPRGHAPPSSSQMQQQMRMPVNPISRPQEHATQPRSSDDGDKFVIPLLNLAQLDMLKLRALNDVGVVSFIPLQSIKNLGIPIMRLRSDVPLGHFPHDSAIEIGPIRRLPENSGNHNPRALPPTVTPPGNIPPPRAAPPHPQPHPQPSHLPNRGQPQSVVSPPVGGPICTDRNCLDLRRPAQLGTIHHNAIRGHLPAPMHNHATSNTNNNNQNYHQQPHGPQHHHESFLGGNGQLIVTPVNRH